MKIYEYNFKTVAGAKATISRGRGYWLLNITVPNRIVIVGHNIWPTKRSALAHAIHIIQQYK